MKRETKPFIESVTVKGRVYHYYRTTVRLGILSPLPIVQYQRLNP